MTNYRKQLEAIGGYENELLPIPAGGVRKIIDDLEKAQQQLAEEQAYSAKLREALEEIGVALHENDGLSEIIGRCLSTPHDNSALREWGARLLYWTFSKGMGGTLLLDTARQLRSGDWKP